jgi:hypothetical protein
MIGLLRIGCALGLLIGGAAHAADVGEPKPDEASAAPFFIVNDNSLSYHYEFTATNPGTGETPKHVVTFTHFDVWKYGTNFVNIDLLKATDGDAAPEAPCGFPNPDTGCSGFTEVYGLWRGTLGWNQVFDTNRFAVDPLKNVSFLFGVDLNTDDTNLHSRKRLIEAGLQFDFGMPYEGYFNVGVAVFKEWQHDGIAQALGTNPSGDVEFDPTWAVELLYVQPLGFLPEQLPLTYQALVTIRGPKGAGQPDAPDRVVEYYTQQTLSLDFGQLVAEKPGVVSVWGGYRWWKNKFGLDPDTTGLCCTTENTWLAGVTWKF